MIYIIKYHLLSHVIILLALFTKIVGPSEDAQSVGQTKKEISEGRGLYRWWMKLIETSKKYNKLHANMTPRDRPYIGAGTGVQGLTLNYRVTENDCAVELYIDRGVAEENKAIFDTLVAHRERCEADFGAPLLWERLDHRRACRIKYEIDLGGYRSPESAWPEIQAEMVSRMLRLEQALGPLLEKVAG